MFTITGFKPNNVILKITDKNIKKITEKYWVYPLFGQKKSVTDKKLVLLIPVAALYSVQLFKA